MNGKFLCGCEDVSQFGSTGLHEDLGKMGGFNLFTPTIHQRSTSHQADVCSRNCIVRVLTNMLKNCVYVFTISKPSHHGIPC